MRPLKFSLLSAIFLVLVFTGFTASRAEAHTAELIFTNNSFTRPINVNIYPISMIFNSYDEYDLHSRYFNSNYHFNIGREYSIQHRQTLATINHDADGTTGNTTASVGYGKYRIVVDWGSGQDTCTVEWDWHFTLAPDPFAADLTIYFDDDNNNPRVSFKWSGSPHEYPIASVNREIVAWDQQFWTCPQITSANNEMDAPAVVGDRSIDELAAMGLWRPPTLPCRRLRAKNYGDFKYDASFGNTYDIFPQDSRRDCGSENRGFEDNRSGVITQHLTIDKNVHTPGYADLLDFPTYITINPKVELRIGGSRTLDLAEITPWEPGDAILMTVKSQATLLLHSAAKVLIGRHNVLTLESGGHITLEEGSEIRVQCGGTFCNEGGTIGGPGHIIHECGPSPSCPAEGPSAAVDQLPEN